MIRIVQSAVSCGSSGTITISPTKAGNLLVAILAFSGTVSAAGGGDTLIEAIAAGSGASIWYCVSNGGTTSIAFSCADTGMWVFEITCPNAAWVLIDQQQGTGVSFLTPLFAQYEVGDSPTDNTVESAVSLAGDPDKNCCYFTVLNGEPIPNVNNMIFSLRWRVHPAVFGSYPTTTSACFSLNASGSQQFQLWSQGYWFGHEHNTCGAAFSSEGGSPPPPPPPPPLGGNQPNVCIVC
jgi:hypothetical protein